ncbi:MAG: hypothetical protein GYB20_09850 [Oceanospirillales bacterium]|nr:hypothetical protein [Oceanospirillales bacterium]MBR9887978.1 hypothetical protein [Oceanospirillales bacterium]
MLQRLKLIIATGVTLLTTGALAADTQNCLQAYTAGKKAQAFQKCHPLAKEGDPQAAFILARLYALGVDGKAPDWEKVVEWLRLSSAANHAEAAYNLAIAYQKGKGTAADPQQSLKYYRQSSELGNPKAMRNLAMLYEKGKGVDQDIGQAFTLYQRSAESGLTDSQLKAGLMLLQGEGVEKDPVAARRWIEKSADAGNDNAQLALGVLLIDFDPETAIHWYAKAAAAGNPYAAHNLALVYSEGQNTPQDLYQALTYARTSLKLGNRETQPLFDRIQARIEAQDARQQSVKTGPEKAGDETDKSLAIADFKGLDWLKAQPPEHFVIQLARLTTPEGAHRFIRDFNLEPIARPVKLGQDDYVILTRDSFVVKADAHNILKAQLPTALAGEAWVRSYRSLYKH